MRKMLLGAVCSLGVLASLAASTGSGATAQEFPIRLTVTKLAPLKGAAYELWVVDGKRKLSAGKFNVDAKGRLVDRLGRPARFVSSVDPSKADTIAVTIEPRRDRNPGPTATIVLAGKPTADAARLRFPVDLGRASGTYVLATPTDSNPNNHGAGVWFLNPRTGGKSLNLPRLPAKGWIWEGWAVTQERPLTTGRFVDAGKPDRSSPFSGTNPAPSVPGEDYVRNLPRPIKPPVNLADGKSLIVVTIEPDLNGADPTGAGPFSIKPLVHRVPKGTAAEAPTGLRRDLSTVPTGTARF